MTRSCKASRCAPFLALFLACAASAGREAETALTFTEPLAWTPRFAGIDLTEMAVEAPVTMRGFAVRVDLRAPGVDFVVTPDNGERAGETDGLRTSSFLTKVGCQVAINANQFSPVHVTEGKAQEVIGLLVDKSEVVSPAEAGLPALMIGKDGTARIGEPPFELEKIRFAVGGFGIVLRQGVVTGDESVRHPRTAAGVSGDGRYLYLLVIDGRQPKYSEGATTAEVGRWLRNLGAAEGINLDGGGTSTLVTRDAEGQASVVNRPIHLGIPGKERPSASHFGVVAKPLEPTPAP